MISRTLRFSWLAATLLVTLALWSQTSATAQTPASGQAALVDQVAAPAQQSAPALTGNLSPRTIDASINLALPAPAETVTQCKENCDNQFHACTSAHVPIASCDKTLNACLKKCG
jgi:hypothetical protein